MMSRKLQSDATSLLHVALWPFTSHPSKPGPELGLVMLLGTEVKPSVFWNL